ncbi:MAG TPA: class I SAM-dependent methyltransferase, partial [bacterium]|nr:class I SAM-dependent methyltransferase [bacterium]
MSAPKSLLEKVDEYYSQRLQEFGCTPRGVDWSSTSAQAIRFQQLMKLLPRQGPFSLVDIGCGYGEL